ncbi:MAG: glycerophosphodiester phosphodiesterase family protein [Bacteroidota bacterium]
MKKVLSSLLLLVVVTAVYGQAVPTRVDSIRERFFNPSDDYVPVVSHRGDWRYAPENSLQAIQRCIDLGVDVVEVDVRLTKDGHLVLMHDKTVDRTTNGKGKLSSLTLAEVRELRLKNACGARGSRIPVPTLEEAMLLARGKIMINLDKTEGETVREAYDVLKKTGTVDHAIFKGNDPVSTMRERYGTLLDSIIYMPKVWYNLPDIAGYIRDFEASIDPLAYESLFDTEENEVLTKAIPQMNAAGTTVLAIALWDELCAGRTDELALLEGPDAAWGWLLDHGANAIMTDRPAELLAYLRTKGLHD